MTIVNRADAENLIQSLVGGAAPGNGARLVFRRDVGWTFDVSGSASYYWSTQGTAAVVEAGTFVKVSTADSTTEVRAENFVVSANNRATYKGTQAKKFFVLYIVTMTMENNNETGHLSVAKNGVVDIISEEHRKVTTGTDSGAISVGDDVELATDDYVELWAMDEDSNGDVMIDHGFCLIFEPPM